MRRVFIYALLLTMGLLFLAYLFAPTMTVEFSQKEIEETVNSKLPHKIDTGFATITVHTATLKFQSNNKVGIETSFEAKGFTLEGEGEAIFETGIRYDDGRFYLSDLTKEDIRFEFSQNSKETISDMKSTVLGILRREEDEAAQSDDENKTERVEKAREYASKKLQSDAEEALDGFLKSIPIYSLNNQGSKLRLAALALEDVRISEGKVTAVLSFQVLIIRVAGAVFSFLLIMLFIFGPIGVDIWRLLSRKNGNSTSK